MRTINLIFVILVMASCTPKNNLEKVNSKKDLFGVWELKKFLIYENGELIKTKEVPEDFRSVKMFSKTKYMWSNKPADSLEWHAYGNYQVIGDTVLVENKEYSSRTMSGHSKKTKLKLILNDSTYTQISFDNNGLPFYGEQYQRVE